MSAAVTMRFDPADTAALRAQMDRRLGLLREGPQAVMRVGFIALCRSMRASTKVSPRRRKVRLPSVESGGRRARSEGNRLFLAEGLDRQTGGTKRIRIWAPSLAVAKLSPKARITKRGLAKASWGWAMQRLFDAPGSFDMFGQASAISVSKMFDRDTGYAEATVDNRLAYISKALSGGRGPCVSTAMRRAAESMRGATDAIIARATREAGY